MSTSIATSTTIPAITATSTRATTGRTASRRRAGRGGALVIAGILAWTVFAFGGLYASSLALPAAACIALAVRSRPRVVPELRARGVDFWMLAALAAVLIQLVPLPRAVLGIISPSAESVARALLLVDPGGALPLSIDARRSAGALLLMAGSFLLFFTARETFVRGGVRTVARTTALTGLVLSAMALAQNATSGGLMYWRWKPEDEGPAPFGPFVNRNHFATWAVMAVPLIVGYLAAHASAHQSSVANAAWRRRMVGALDGRAWLLLTSAAALIVGIAASLSRSGIVGLGAALISGALIARSRRDRLAEGSRATGFVAALGVIAVLAVLTHVGAAVIAQRFGASPIAMANRLTIWHDTLPVLREFWLTGTGAGTYLTSMSVYQRSSPGIIFNQAHNHYLQLAAEGGLLVGIPVVLAIAAFVRTASRCLAADRSGMFWIRAGAAAGLCGVAVQSVWETGLTLPANAAMAAVLAAIAVNAPEQR